MTERYSVSGLLAHFPWWVLPVGVLLALGLGTDWVIAIGVMSALLISRHKDNIKRLIAGQESRIGSKKKSPGA